MPLLPFLASAAVLLGSQAAPRASAGSDLESAFRDPPANAKPTVWWHWMNGHISREGITADLEAMKRVGLAGATLFDVWEKIPDGPVPYGSAEWHRMKVFAAQEAARLGLELSIQSTPGWSSSGGPWITPELAMQKVVAREIRVVGPTAFLETLAQPDSILGFYRDVAVLAFPDEPVLDPSKLVDLTTRLGSDGRLEWNVPAGAWTILRVGHTPTGSENRAAPAPGRGLECDKLSRAGIETHWAHAVAPILEEFAALPATTLRSCLLDSYEVGDQDWTPRMREEFRSRRGYDLLPYLPVLAGRTVESPEASERFRWDLSRTIDELFASEYHGRFAELCHENGLQAVIEPYEGPFDSFLSGAKADVPTGEFWVDGHGEGWCELAASIAHVYGKRIVASEAFTADPKTGRWQNHPAILKAVGDRLFCAGVNRFAIHRYAHQPWTDGNGGVAPGLSPGMTMGQWGIHYERTTTWWNQSEPWIGYLSRSQALLQAGRPVADVLVLLAEGAASASDDARLVPPLVPEGFRADTIGPDALIERVSARDGRLVTSEGVSYRLLALPETDSMTPELLERLVDLVEQGATVLGRPQHRSPSLRGQPAADERVRELSKRLFGSADGEIIRVHGLGRGRAFFGATVESVLGVLGVAPDCRVTPQLGLESEGPAVPIRWIHRSTPEGEVYFLSNQEPREVLARASFRVRGQRPELWRADRGTIETAAVWRSVVDRIEVPLRFEPSGSLFVVFRHPAEGFDPVVDIGGPGCELTVTQDGRLEFVAFLAGKHTIERASGDDVRIDVDTLPAPIAIRGPWKLRFSPGLGAPDSIELDALGSWTENENPGLRTFSGTATYETEFDLPAGLFESDGVLRLDLGRVECLAEVELNGVDLGTWWKPPFVADVRTAAQVGRNRLVVRVTNLWVNRLIGDEQLPPIAEYVGKQLKEWPAWLRNGQTPPTTGRVTFSTWRHYKPDSPLLPSGLLGPVTIVAGARASIGAR